MRRAPLCAIVFVLSLSALATTPARADERATGCEGEGCTCNAGEGGGCPLHRPGTKRPTRERDPAFDAKTLVMMYGVVTAVERAPREVRLSVRVGTQTISVRLGPARFVDALISFAEADAVQFTGSSVVIDGQPSVLATEVTRGGKTVRLRQDDGTPLFTR